MTDSLSKSEPLEVVSFENGTASVRLSATGEAMHSSIGPEAEARQIYLTQSDLPGRLFKADSQPLVIFDVGLGIAANALAALSEFERLSPPRPLRIVSFENRPEGLSLALSESGKFPFLKGREALLQQLLEKGIWHQADARLAWELRIGDFRDGLEALPAPELIYFDLYSPKILPELWSRDTFRRLHALCRPDHSPRLITYSASTAVRTALLLAGFYVGSGISTDKKLDTTLATLRLDDLTAPLGAEWLARFERSTQGIPSDLKNRPKAEILELLRRHPQFR